MANSEIEGLRAEMAALREQLQQLALAMEMMSEGDGDVDGGSQEDDSWQEVVPTIGAGGGTYMGNTEDSEKIRGNVMFESADDSAVEITTEKRTNEGDEEEKVIKIGVYYK